jgi:hypothetical protein
MMASLEWVDKKPESTKKKETTKKKSTVAKVKSKVTRSSKK